MFAGRLDKRLVLPYIFCQLLGAISAAATLRFLFPEHATLGATLPDATLLQAFVMEVLLTFFLMFVILNISTGHMEKGIMVGVAVGATVTLDALIGGPVTGASMNPARSLGPALLAGHFEALWIYLTAPVGRFQGSCRRFPGSSYLSMDSRRSVLLSRIR